jgi:hypothetical protein
MPSPSTQVQEPDIVQLSFDMAMPLLLECALYIIRGVLE